MNQTICNAINSRTVIRFYYEGGHRTVEPFCHGITQEGEDVLRGYQIAGYSSSTKPIGWRLFKVSEISDLTITNDTFSAFSRRDYNRRDRAMVRIYCCV